MLVLRCRCKSADSQADVSPGDDLRIKEPARMDRMDSFVSISGPGVSSDGSAVSRLAAGEASQP